MVNFHIVSIFPDSFESYLNASILKRAIEKKLIAVKFYNPRDFTTDKHRKTDDRPYGGGPGMVMYAEPIINTVESIKEKIKSKKTREEMMSEVSPRTSKSEVGPPKIKVILFSAQGKLFINSTARKLSKYTDVILICGRYEGIDARVKKILRAEEVSIGPYILTGGELPAMVLIDSISRQIKGVLGKEDSIEEGRVASRDVYTRPEILEYKGKKYKVPKVLLSGNHKKIEEYKIGLKNS